MEVRVHEKQVILITFRSFIPGRIFLICRTNGVVQLDTLKYKLSGSIINSCHCYCGMKWKPGLSLGPPESASAGPGPSHGRL